MANSNPNNSYPPYNMYTSDTRSGPPGPQYRGSRQPGLQRCNIRSTSNNGYDPQEQLQHLYNRQGPYYANNSNLAPPLYPPPPPTNNRYSAPAGHSPCSPFMKMEAPSMPPPLVQYQPIAYEGYERYLVAGPSGPPPPPPPPASVKVEPRTSVQAEDSEKEAKTKPQILVGKRRGGRVLPTGVVKKPRLEDPSKVKKDPWSQYMNEVKKYKDQSCEEDRKNRPLVK